MISKLFVKPVKGGSAVSVSSLTLVEGRGVEGDCHADGGERSVCLITESTENALAGIGEKKNCLVKFTCNVVLSGGRELSVGDTVGIGSALLTVTLVGRECHELCAVPDCPLISGIIFARVSKGGKISVGDSVSYA